MSRRGIVFGALLLATTTGAFAQSVLITTPTPMPTGYVGVSYVLQLTASTNPPNQTLTWSFPGNNAGLAPPGLTLAANGNYFGTPTAAGTYTFTIAASFGQSFPVTGTQQFSITIIQPRIAITTSAALPNGIVGQGYSATFTATNNTPFATVWGAANFPPGLIMNSQTGQLSGSPGAAGSYVGTVTATINGTNYSTLQTFSLQIFSGQVAINTTSLPLAPITQPYSAQLLATPSGVTWTLLGGTTTLPPGITFSSSGTFSGTPTTPGAYQLMLQADLVESTFESAQTPLTLYVTTGPLKIVQNSIPVAIQNVAYQTTLTPTGGLAPYRWSTQNSVGMSISATSGVISGTPTTLGPQSLPVTLTDSTGTSFVEAFAFFVAAPLSVLTTSLPSGIVGQPYNQSLVAGGGQAPYVWSIPPSSSSTPPGLTLSSGGTITGTPTANGTFSFTVQVTDVGQRVATTSLSISVIASTIAITTASLPDGLVGVAYTQTLAAAGGTPPYTWAVTSGSLPAGIALDPKGGTLSGTPTGPAGPSNFAIQITDSTPGAAPLTAQKAFTLNINVAISITTATLPNGSVGVAYPQTTLAASGGKPPYTWSIASGALPGGLQLSASTGAISGTPAAAGSFLFTASVTDSASQSAQRQYSITIAAGGTPLSITTGNLSATVGVAFAQTLAASGGTSPYTFALTGGTLPAGLAFSSGAITGTPTTAGTSSLTFTVTDANKQTATATITFTVSLPGTPPVTFTIGSASQPPVTLCLTSAFPVPVTATLTLSFQASSSVAVGTDQSVQFASPSHGTSVSFTLPPCTQTTPSAVVTQGTVAGTITITAKLSANGSDVTPSNLAPQTIAVAAVPPVIQSVKLTPGTGSVTVTVTGYSSTREMVSGLFHFAPATGSTLSQSDITVQLGSAFGAWYQSAASNTIGSQFQLTIPFTVSGSSANVVAVTVTLTNTKGASTPMTSQ
jgi:hypothetical protein